MEYSIKKESYLVSAIDLYMKLGDWNKACQLLNTYQDFETAMMVSPIVSLELWNECKQKYVEAILKKQINCSDKEENDYRQALAYLIATDYKLAFNYYKEKQNYDVAKLIWITRRNPNDRQNSVMKQSISQEISGMQRGHEIYDLTQEIAMNFINNGNNILCAAISFFSLNLLNEGVITLARGNAVELSLLVIQSISEFELEVSKSLSTKQILLSNQTKEHVYSLALFEMLRREVACTQDFITTIKIAFEIYSKSNEEFLARLILQLLFYGCNLVGDNKYVGKFKSHLSRSREAMLACLENNEVNALAIYLIKLEFDKILEAFSKSFEILANSFSTSFSIESLRLTREQLSYIYCLPLSYFNSSEGTKLRISVIILGAFIDALYDNTKSAVMFVYEIIRMVKEGYKLKGAETKILSIIMAHLIKYEKSPMKDQELLFFDIPSQFRDLADLSTYQSITSSLNALSISNCRPTNSFYVLREEAHPCNVNCGKRSSMTGNLIKGDPVSFGKNINLSKSESLEWLKYCCFSPLSETVEYLI